MWEYPSWYNYQLTNSQVTVYLEELRTISRKYILAKKFIEKNGKNGNEIARAFKYCNRVPVNRILIKWAIIHMSRKLISFIIIITNFHFASIDMSCGTIKNRTAKYYQFPFRRRWWCRGRWRQQPVDWEKMFSTQLSKLNSSIQFHEFSRVYAFTSVSKSRMVPRK